MDAMDRVANDALPEPRALNSSIPPNVSKVIMNGMQLSGELRIQTVTEFVTQLFEEPEFNKKKQVTQTVSIPKQKKSGEKTSKKKKDSRGKVFWLVLIASAIGMMVLMSILIMSLDDDSSNILVGVTTTTKVLSDMTEENSDTISGEMTDPDETDDERDTSSGMSVPPTLAVIETTGGEESGETSSVSLKNGGTVYIMNDLTGKSYDMIKNTAVNDNLTIIPDFVYTDEYERGMIFDQSIEKGTAYEKGQECILSISMGPGKAIVPEYTGLSRKDYFDLLNSRGIKYEEKSYDTEDVLNGYVAWIGMEPGEEINIEEGEVLEVFIARNNRTETTTVSTTIVTIPTEPEPTAWITTEPIVFTMTEPDEPPDMDPIPVFIDTSEPDVTLRGDY